MELKDHATHLQKTVYDLVSQDNPEVESWANNILSSPGIRILIKNKYNILDATARKIQFESFDRFWEFLSKLERDSDSYRFWVRVYMGGMKKITTREITGEKFNWIFSIIGMLVLPRILNLEGFDRFNKAHVNDLETAIVVATMYLIESESKIIDGNPRYVK